MQNTKLAYPMNDPGLMSPRSLVLFPRRVTKAGGILGKLCIRCGAYSGSNHDYCMQCVEKLKKTNPFQRDYWENTKRSTRSKITPRSSNLAEQKKNAGSLCTECKASVTVKNQLCLICDAKKRGRMRERTMFHFNLIFGDGDLIRSYVSSGMSGESIKSESKLNTGQRLGPLDDKIELKRLNMSRTADPIIFQDINKHLEEAISIRDEFLASKPDDGADKWENLYHTKKLSLQQKEEALQKLRLRTRREKEKQSETKEKMKKILKQCEEHFELQKPKLSEKSPDDDKEEEKE